MFDSAADPNFMPAVRALEKLCRMFDEDETDENRNNLGIFHEECLSFMLYLASLTDHVSDNLKKNLKAFFVDGFTDEELNQAIHDMGNAYTVRKKQPCLSLVNFIAFDNACYDHAKEPMSICPVFIEVLRTYGQQVIDLSKGYATDIELSKMQLELDDFIDLQTAFAKKFLNAEDPDYENINPNPGILS